jgi:hypothetical protein
VQPLSQSQYRCPCDLAVDAHSSVCADSVQEQRNAAQTGSQRRGAQSVVLHSAAALIDDAAGLRIVSSMSSRTVKEATATLCSIRGHQPNPYQLFICRYRAVDGAGRGASFRGYHSLVPLAQ